MMAYSRYSVRFTSPLLSKPDTKAVHKQLITYFNEIRKVDKLYICEEYGQIYAASEEVVDAILAGVALNNPHDLNMSTPVSYENKGVMRNNYGSRDNSTGITTSVDKQSIVDANCVPLAILTDPTHNTQYVSVADARTSGFHVFSSPDQAQKHIINDLKDYLNNQMQLFMKIKGLNYSPTDFKLDVTLAKDNCNNDANGNRFNGERRGSDAANRSFSPRMDKNPTPLMSREQKKPFMKSRPNEAEKIRPEATNSQEVQNHANTSGALRPRTNKVQEAKKSSPAMSPSQESPANGVVPDLSFRSNSRSSQISDSSVKNNPKIEMTPREKISMLTRATSSSACKPMNIAAALAASPKLQPVVKPTKLVDYPAHTAFVANMANYTGRVPMQVLDVQSPTMFTAYLVVMNAIEFDTVLAAENMDNEILTPSVGDLVLVSLPSGDRSRAYVLELLPNKFRVAAFDYATVVEVDCVYEVSNECKAFEEFSCICETATPLVNKTDDQVDDVYVTGNNELIMKAKNVAISCRRWIPEEYLKQQPAPPKPMPPKPVQRIFTSIPSLPELQLNEKVLIFDFKGGVMSLRTKPICVQLKNMEAAMKIAKLEKLELPPNVGQYFLWRNPDSDEILRCVVKTITDNRITFETVDYYNRVESTTLAEMLNFVDDAVFMPGIYVKRLHHFEDKTYSEAASEAIAKAINSKATVVYLQDDIVDLQCNDGQLLSAFVKAADGPPIKTLADLPAFNLEVDQECAVFLTYMQDEQLFLTSVDFAKKHIESVTTLNAAEAEPPLLKIRVGQLVLTPFEGEWYRSVITEIDGRNAMVWYIDFGNKEQVDVSVVKQIPESVVNIAPLVFEVKLSPDSQPLGEEHVSSQLVVKICEKRDNVYIVKVLEVIM